jgi:hypothetical protein
MSHNVARMSQNVAGAPQNIAKMSQNAADFRALSHVGAIAAAQASPLSGSSSPRLAL